jgi:hypothetical protein
LQGICPHVYARKQTDRWYSSLRILIAAESVGLPVSEAIRSLQIEACLMIGDNDTPGGRQDVGAPINAKGPIGSVKIVAGDNRSLCRA